MKTTFVLKNNGTDKRGSLILQVSYFTLTDDQEKIEEQNFNLKLSESNYTEKTIDFGDKTINDREVIVLLKRLEGNIITQNDFSLEEINNQKVQIDFSLNKEIELISTNQPNISSEPHLIYGRLLDRRGIHKMEDVQIILFGKQKEDNDFSPITTIRTESKGYFTLQYVEGYFIEAVAQIGMNIEDNPIPIKLVNSENDSGNSKLVFPKNLVLVVDVNEGESNEDENAECDCGCNSLNLDEKRIVEEYSFFSLVRTTEPEIKGYVLEEEDEISLVDILKTLPISIFELIEPIKASPLVTRKSPLNRTKDLALTGSNIRAARVPNETTTTDTESDDFIKEISHIKINKSVLRNFLNKEKGLTRDNIGNLLKVNETTTFANNINENPPQPKPLGRVELNKNNSIDWDMTPTIYQSVEVAHGHLLQFKTEWFADGYSLGDLLYSLPLAPGQKKQIVVFDWERRESASNIQALDYEEALSNSLIRDRDVFEIAKGVVSEHDKGSSSATTVGIAAGAFGSFFGIAGGVGHSNSNATQNSLRKVSSSDHQKLRDRLKQSSNNVRSMRSTVIQTVAQGEPFEVSSESVANYNHCHAMTMQYFEVLRHFKIRQRFSGARECLFVPLLMSSYNLKKALRWKEILSVNLLDRKLITAFESGDRVLHKWKNSNFPEGTYASENIVHTFGKMKFTFVIQRPKDKEDENILKFDPAAWAWLREWGIESNPQEFYNEFLKGQKLKDEIFHRELGEKIGKAFINSLQVEVIDRENNPIGKMKFDFNLSSRYHRNIPLTVTLNSSPTGKIFTRDQVYFLHITSDKSSELPPNSFITVKSGFMRYETNHFKGTLFNYTSIGDDLTNEDGMFIYTGLNNDELRNPQKDDITESNKLVAHLNDNLEHYETAIWKNMSDERRFMLIDGIILNGKGEGRSVASLVENTLLAVVGNSMVFPVCPGLNLDPSFGSKGLLDEFYSVASSEPISVSVPTKGVFAEAIMGNCNSCEEKDDSRFWRWEESPIPDSPTSISPINTDSRRRDPNMPQPNFPDSKLSIQDAPDAPNPTGMNKTLELLAKSNLFKDITGLSENQKNALNALKTAMESSTDLAKTGGYLRLLEEAQAKGLLKNVNTGPGKLAYSLLDPNEKGKKEKQKKETERIEKKKNSDLERELTKKDTDAIKEAKDKNQIDESQSKVMTEDRIRKGQGTTKPKQKRSSIKGKKKFNLQLIMNDLNGAPLNGAFQITFGSLIEHEFVVSDDTGVVNFEVELDTSKDNVLVLKGNPFVSEMDMQSHPGNKIYYYHFLTVHPKLGDDTNLTFTISQNPEPVVVSVQSGSSVQVIQQKAFSKAWGLGAEIGGEIEYLIGKISGKVSLDHSEDETNTDSTGTTTTTGTTTSYRVLVPERKLIFKNE